jgi:vitamin B12 transporter
MRTLGVVEFGADALYSGPRRDSQFPGFVTLHSYVLANIHARFTLAEHWSLIAQIDNVFNTNYEIARTYSTAGRSGSLAVRWNIR